MTLSSIMEKCAQTTQGPFITLLQNAKSTHSLTNYTHATDRCQSRAVSRTLLAPGSERRGMDVIDTFEMSVESELVFLQL